MRFVVRILADTRLNMNVCRINTRKLSLESPKKHVRARQNQCVCLSHYSTTARQFYGSSGAQCSLSKACICVLPLDYYDYDDAHFFSFPSALGGKVIRHWRLEGDHPDLSAAVAVAA